MLAMLLLLLSSKDMTEALFIQKSNIICWADTLIGFLAYKPEKEFVCLKTYLLFSPKPSVCSNKMYYLSL